MLQSLVRFVFLCLAVCIITNTIAQPSKPKNSKTEPVKPALAAYEKYIDDNNEAHLKEFIELISIPSISSIPAHKPDVQRAAEWIVNKLKSIGIPTA
ncbi:MAG: hypothetical protein RL596_1889, partial [Bacteroidota bacterium]